MNLKTMEPQDFGITAKGTSHQATSFRPNFRKFETFWQRKPQNQAFW
jgi:hypothetical protein